jgi:DNA processing protein
LLEAFQSPEAVLAGDARAWQGRAQLTDSACARLREAARRDVGKELARLDTLGVRLLAFFDDDYPARLRAIPDPPVALFVKGTLIPEDARAIAIVGSRRASPYGRHAAAELAAELARHSFTVVSGMALGADAAAHEGALRAGGRTIAVLACGVDVIYPPEHLQLYERIAAQGAVVSEAPLGAPPSKFAFPQRNRIISGLCPGVVVVEAPERSGALITASHALEQGREVFAVPGSINSVQSRGTHNLLKDGAKLVASVEDILEELDLLVPVATPVRRHAAPMQGPSWDEVPAEPVHDSTILPLEREAPAEPHGARASSRAPKTAREARKPAFDTPIMQDPDNLPPEELALVRLLTETAKHVDDLIEASGLSSAQASGALLMLELKGYVQRRPGNVYVRLR